nr:ImcF-related family protein [Rubellimicrobium arenae]
MRKARSDSTGDALPSGRGAPFDRAAAPALALADELAELPDWQDTPGLLREARSRLDRFADELKQAGIPAVAIPPARLALGFVIDRRARANPGLPWREWGAGAHRLLFEGEEMSEARLRDFVARAEAAGPSLAALAAFLRSCRDLAEPGDEAGKGSASDGWAGLLVGAVLGFLLLVLGWMVQAEWRFHRETARAFAAEALLIGLDRPGEIPDLGARLDRLAAAVDDADRSLARAPIHLFAGPLGFDAATAIHARQSQAIGQHLPPALGRAIGRVLAQEGDSVALYDTLRAWDILSGAADWNPAYLQGWLADRSDLLPELQDLVPHVGRLVAPTQPLAPVDGELLAQARGFAAEASETDRAWIELARSSAMAGLPPWRPTSEVPGLDEIAVRRSGLPIGTPIPGLYTAAGWDLAGSGAAAAAVATARAEARRMFNSEPGTTPEPADLVMARLQEETLRAWNGFLADLRVRPLDRPATAVRVSGLLARRASPLEVLLRAAWVEVGGPDRSRPQPLQLKIAAAFGPTIQFLEQGGPGRLSDLFAALNAALGAREADEDQRSERLSAFQSRAAAIAALRQAPPVVVQVVEDVLAQTTVPRADQIANPFTQRWQRDVFDLCRRVAEGRFPFDPAGQDADPADFAALLGPGGALDRFVQGEAGPYLDMTASPWRWRPEARFSGLSAQSAEMFEQAQSVRLAFFGSSGQLGTSLSLATLAERGKAEIALGGATASVDAASDAVTLDWPGADPAAGVAVTFGGSEGGLSHAGPWGLLRLAAGLRLRERDGGRRFLLDLRSDAGRLFVELSFPSAANPIAGLALAKGFTCPAAL